jgi:hypothetical protein
MSRSGLLALTPAGSTSPWATLSMMYAVGAKCVDESTLKLASSRNRLMVSSRNRLMVSAFAVNITS